MFLKINSRSGKESNMLKTTSRTRYEHFFGDVFWFNKCIYRIHELDELSVP